MRVRWRANFYPVGIAHSVVTGSAWAPAPWIAVQRAALGGFIGIVAPLREAFAASMPRR